VQWVPNLAECRGPALPWVAAEPATKWMATGTYGFPVAVAGVKLKFAHQLRALAALSVVIHHYGGIFFAPGVRALLGIPAGFDPAQPAYALHVMSPPFGQFYYGVFGVGVFFLISGFVIPISLRKISTGEFLVRRFFRIYPVYWCCLLISAGMYVLCSWYWSTPWPDRISARFLLANLPLLHSTAGLPSLDFVCWSLTVELKFYLLFSLLFAACRSAQRMLLLSIGVLALACIAAWLFTRTPDPHPVFAGLVADMRFISFMFLGCLFYYVLFGELAVRSAFGYGVVIYGLFVGISSFYEHLWFGPLVKNYSYALIVFAIAFVWRDRFRGHRVIDFLADISFPLYLLHSVSGYVLMSMLIHEGTSFTFAWIISLTLVMLAAWLVHRYVELPVNAFGKQVTRSRLQRPLPEPG
jgi:peptidoglycan/LPS O-acetylase OafA/YrhL